MGVDHDPCPELLSRHESDARRRDRGRLPKDVLDVPAQHTAQRIVVDHTVRPTDRPAPVGDEADRRGPEREDIGITQNAQPVKVVGPRSVGRLPGLVASDEHRRDSPPDQRSGERRARGTITDDDRIAILGGTAAKLLGLEG